jgi:DNA-binding GntR family transcriptional regulator
LAVKERAEWLRINLSTVARAYFLLKQQGSVVTSRRLGTIILNEKRLSQRTPFSSSFGDTNENNPIFYLIEGSGTGDIEATFALHLSRWRVQRMT